MSDDWRDLRTDWQSTAHDPVFTSRVRISLLARIWLARVWLACELLSALMLGFIVVQNFIVGRHGTAAVLLGIGAACAAGWWWARRVRLAGNLQSLRGMVDLTVTRARRTLRLVFGSYVVLGLALLWAVRREEDFLPTQIAWVAISLAVMIAIHVWTFLRLRRFTALRAFLGGN
jgi:hypothetical protein